MQKHVNLVDLVKSFPTNIYLQNLVSIQKRTSPVKFAHLAEKSEKGSIPNLSTKVRSEPGEPRLSCVEAAHASSRNSVNGTVFMAINGRNDAVHCARRSVS